MTEKDVIFIAGLQIHVRRKSNARNYSLRVNAQSRRIFLTMPIYGSIARAIKFAEAHRDWMTNKWDAIAHQKIFTPGGSVPLRGTLLTIHHDDRSRAIECTHEGLFIGGKIEHLPRRLRDFLKAEAKKDITPLCLEKAKRIDMPALPIRIKEMHTRWGSCGRALNFNWRLIMAPPYVLDYVVAHEVAHLKHRHHKKVFWNLCQELCPETKAARDWLVTSGGTLYRFG